MPPGVPFLTEVDVSRLEVEGAADVAAFSPIGEPTQCSTLGPARATRRMVVLVVGTCVLKKRKPGIQPGFFVTQSTN